MSKIFGYYHSKPTILRFVKKRQNVRLLIGEKVLLLLTSSIGISGLLVAVDTFKANSSVELQPLRTDIEYYPEDWTAFYNDNNILIPKRLKQVIQTSINEKNRIESHEPMIGEGSPDKDIIEKTRQGGTEGLQWFIERRSERMESVIDAPNYKPRVFTWGRGGYVDSDRFKKLSEKYKSILPPLDYYYFLAAAISCRIVRSQFWIRNTGELDLRKVDIFLSSPIRSSTLTRDGNIVGVDIGIYEVFEVVSSDDDSYRISIPSLAVNEAIHLTVITRETQIESNEVLFAFESVIKVNSNKLLLFWLLAFVSLLLLVWLLSSRGSLRERRARHRPIY